MALRLINGAEFIHIPKTGGSWVTSILESNNLVSKKMGHMHANYDLNLFYQSLTKLSGREHLSKALDLLMKRQKSYNTTNENPPFRFCFVRNPISWYESWWKYAKGRDWREFGEINSSNKWHPNSILNGLGSNDFNEFIWNIIKERPGYVSELLFSYTKPGISFIGRTEYIREDLKELFTILNLEYDKTELQNSPKLNISKTPKSAVEWDPKLRKNLMKLELPALIHFGYLSKDEQLELGISNYIPPNKALFLR